MRTMFTVEERAAIGELVKVAELVSQSTNPDVTMLGATVLERAATIIRGEAEPNMFTDDDVLAFAAFWNVEERAAFNPGPPTKGRVS